MIERLSWSFAHLFVRKAIIPEEDSDIYAFGLECLLASGLQWLLLGITGLLLGHVFPVLVITAGFVLVKQHIGGYHANTHWGCIVWFTTVANLAAILCRLLPVWSAPLLWGAAMMLIVIVAPVPHPNNPRTAEELARGKQLGIRISAGISAVIGVLLLSPLLQYAVCLALGLFIAAFSLLIPNRGGEQCEGE